MSKVSSIFLPTNEYLGVLSVMAGIKDAAVINHGTSGCNFYSLVTASKKARKQIHHRFVSTGMLSEDISLTGGEDKLKLVIEEMAQRPAVSLIVIVANPVAELIGVDVKAIAKEVENHIDVPIITFSQSSWKYYAENGAEEAMEQLVRFYCPPPEQKITPHTNRTSSANIIGPMLETYRWEEDEKEIERLLEKLGITINVVFPYNVTTEQIKALRNAQINIVTEASGLKVAQYLKEYYDIPYVYGLPYGEQGTKQWLEEVAMTLGENVLSPIVNDRSFDFHHHLEIVAGGDYYQRNWRTVLSCSAAMAKRFVQLVKEDWQFPLEAVRITDKVKANEIEELQKLGVNRIFETPHEREWREIIEDIQPFILIGNSEDMLLASDVAVQLLISDPMFSQFHISDGKPHVGFSGYKVLTQQLFQQISRSRLGGVIC